MLLELSDIQTTFNAGSPDEMRLFTGFSLAVQEGQFVSVIGSNGSGKTTLLNLVCGTMRPDAGKIVFDGRDITAVSAVKRASWIGRVFQDPKAGTCAHLTILENLALADNKGKPYGLGRGVSKSRREHYRALLSQCGMGLENRLDTLVGTLSGGQRQALALVIVCKLLLDAFLRTKSGLLLRATGDNAGFVTMLSRDPGRSKILGLAIGNGFAALSGAVIAQAKGSADQQMGTGMVVLGLASVIIGLSLFKGFKRIRPTTAVVFGSIAYKACLSVALALGLPTEYLKLLMAALFVLALVAGEKPLFQSLFKRRQSDAA